MKGLYVYGALSMALSFTVGVQSGNGWLVALSLAAAMSAAGAVAGAELYRAGYSGWLVDLCKWAAPLSWLLTAAAGLYAILVSVS